MMQTRTGNRVKKIWMTAGFLFLAAAIAAADDVSRALSGIAPGEVIESTRELIQSGIQDNRAIEVTRAMVQNKFEAQQVLNAHRVLLNAHRQGLPPDPIINKALEGMSKQVSAGKIIGAMEKVEARYAFAHTEAGKLSSQKVQLTQTADLIVAGLAAGLTPESITAIADGLQARSRGMDADPKDALALETFKTARDMARLGVSPQQTAAVVSRALAHQFTAAQMQNMRSAFMQDSRTTAPNRLAVDYGKAISKGKSFESAGGAQAGQGGSRGSAGTAPGGLDGSGQGGSGGTGNGAGGPGSGGGGPGGSGSGGTR